MAFAFIATSITYSGIERILIREISKDPYNAERYLGHSLILRWCYMAAVIAIVTTFIWFINLSFEVILGIYIAMIAMHLAAESFIYSAMFKAFEKMQYEIYLTFVFQSIYIGFVILITYLKLEFVVFFICLLVANLARVILSILIARKKFRRPNFKLNLSLIKPLIKESFTLGVLVLLMQFFVNVDLFILKTFKSTSDVSMFYAPNNLIILMSLIPLSLMSGFFPALSRSAKEGTQLLSLKYEKAFKIFSIFSIFLATLFVVFPHKIILILYGKEFLNSLISFRILAASIVFLMLSAVFDFTLVAIKRQNTLILCLLIGLIIRIVLDLLLIPKYSYIGASIAATSGYFVFFAITFTMISKYIGGLSVRKYIFQPVLLAGIIGVCLLAVNQGNMLILGTLAFVIYGLCLFLIRFFSPDEITLFKSIFHKAMVNIYGR